MFSKATRFEVMLEAVPDALVGMDQKGVIRFVNRQTEMLFGYDRDELIGEPVETLVPQPLWEIYAEHQEDYFADLRTRSSGLDLELSGRHRDGSEFPASISLSHIDTGDVLLVITAVRDIAKQKQAVKNAQLMAAIVEYSDDAITGSTLKGLITSWNPAAERMYGYSGKEIIGKPGSILFPEDRASELSAVLARVTESETVEHLETVHARKDGSVVPVSITISPIRDEGGAVVGVCAVHRDVTEHRKAFEASQRMAAIVESSDDAIIALTLEGTVTSWNPAAERMFGYTSDEIVGKPAETITSPKDRPEEMQDILAKVRAGQHIDHLETIRVRKDGSVFPASLTISPILDADGTTIGTSMISRDMAELKHAARYARSLIEAAMDPLMTISTEGTINDVNEATIEVTGVARDELIGTDFSHYFTDPDKARDGYSQAFAHGSLTDYPLTLRHRDGTLTDVLYSASVYRDFNENILGVSAVARDASKLHQQEQLSEQLQEALESRIVIEQAKGITSQRHGERIDQAYERMRTHARDHNTSLRTVARAIVDVDLQI